MDTWAILVSLIILFFSIYYWLTRSNYFEKRGVIHMKPLPLIGNSAPIILRRQTFAGYVEKMYNFHNEAKYIGFYDFNDPCILIRDPELIKSITVKNFDHFVDHRDFVDAEQEPLFGKNLFVLKGHKWREMRNLLSPTFTSSKMRAMFKLMSNCAENFTDYLVKEADKQELEVNSKDIFTRYTNDVIATCAFGVSVDSMTNPKNEFYTLCRKATTFDTISLLKFVLMKKFPTLTKALKIRFMNEKVESFFKELVRNTVETRDREGIIRPDMIQLMMDSRSKKTGDGPNLTIHDMTAQAFIFFLAGFETTATLMCFVAHLISINPEVQKKMHEEIDHVREQCQDNLTYEAINNMEYLEAVIYETLRLYPVQPAVDRLCTRTFELPPALPGKSPVIIQPGDCVFLPIYGLHRDCQYFPNANDFYPERFVDNPKETLHNPMFFPFGAGPRMCIGNRFALLETKVLIFHLMTRCSLKPGKKMILPLQLDPKMPAMNAKGDFWLNLTPRDNWKQMKSPL